MFFCPAGWSALMRGQENEGPGLFEIRCLVPSEVGMSDQSELADARALLEVDPVEVYPDHAG